MAILFCCKTLKYFISNIFIQNQELLMFISKKSMESLQIFKEEVHPSLIKGKGKSKEGFSLYNVAFITTSQGRRLLKKKMKNPIYDKANLLHRLDILKILLKNFNEEDYKTLRKNLAKICDLGTLLIKFRDYRTQFEDWRKLKQSLDGVFHLFSFLKSHPNLSIFETKIKFFYDLLHLVPYESLEALRNIINKCLNFTGEGAKKGSIIEINHGINEELDNLKRVFYQLDEFLELYAQDELNKLRSLSQRNPLAKQISSIGFSFFPQVGYMILIPKSDTSCDQKHNNEKETMYPSTKISDPYLQSPIISEEESNISDENDKEKEDSNDDIKSKEAKFNYKEKYDFNPKIDTNTNRNENVNRNNLWKQNFYKNQSNNFNFHNNFSQENSSIYQENNVINKNFSKNNTNKSNENDNFSKESSNINNSNTFVSKENAEMDSNIEASIDKDFDERDLLLKHETINHLRQNLPHRKIFQETFGLSEDWDFHFELENFLYFKNAFTNDLDLAYGDIYEHSIAIEQEILRTLEDEVLRNNESLLYLNDLIGEIDFFLAIAITAKEYNLKCPEITDEPILMIHKGRHLLMEILLRQSFIPNSFVVYNYKDQYDNNFEAAQNSLINKNYSNRVSILTGPNFSGKSVFLKQIGIIVYMAQIGSYVPAEYCKLGLFDKILTNIHLNDSLSCEENGLLEEIQGMLENIRISTNRSLLLIDELGRNSNFDDNLSLFIALVKYLSSGVFPINKSLSPSITEENIDSDSFLGNFFEKMKKQYNRIPLSILTTHLKDLEIIQENYLVRYLEMQVVFLDNKQIPIDFGIESMGKNYCENRLKQWKLLNLSNKLVYLYKLKPGFSLKSFAIFLANELLNEEWIIKRAFQVQISLLELEKIQILPDLEKKFFDKTKIIIEKINK